MLHPREYRFRVDPKTCAVVGQAKTVAELRDLFMQLNADAAEIPASEPEPPKELTDGN